MTLSLVIINSNGAPYLRNYFDSVGQWKTRLDMIFVDNGSSDNSIQIAKQYGVNKIIPFMNNHHSRAALYNSAISRVESSYILFTHSDIIFCDRFFETLQQYLETAAPLDFMNFKINYVDKISAGPTILFWKAIGDELVLFYKTIWNWPGEGFKKLLSCSESCFLVSSSFVSKTQFSEDYSDSLFIEDLMMNLISQKKTIVDCEEISFEHYYIEEHEKMLTIDHDLELFRSSKLQLGYLVAALEHELEDRTTWALEMNQELKLSRNHFAVLQKEFEKRTAWAMTLDAEVKQKGERIVILQKEVEERTAWAKRLGEEVTQCRELIANLRKELEEKSQNALMEVKSRDEHNCMIESQVRQKCEELLEVDEKLKTKCLELASKDDEFRRVCELKTVELKKLKEELKEKDHIIQNFVTSMSWRVTSPLRLIYEVFLRLRKKL